MLFVNTEPSTTSTPLRASASLSAANCSSICARKFDLSYPFYPCPVVPTNTHAFRPALELVNYHVLSRIFRYIPHLAPLKPVLVMPVFGVVMSVVETLNSVGVSLFTNPVAASSRQAVGKNLVLAAVILQMVIILVFFAMVGVFHSRCVKAGVLTTQHEKKEINLRAPLWTLYGSMALILVRCIYRLVEKLAWNYALFPDFAQLRKLSPLIRYEWFFYVFEATLILLNSGIWNVWHPGRFLPASHRAVLHEDGTAAGNSGKEVMGVNAAGV